MPFRDLPGDSRLPSLLSRAIARDTLPPSLLFTGPEGAGKRATAIAVAQAFNCQAPVEAGPAAPLPVDACGRCSACRRIASGNHPDVLVVLPGESGAIKIEETRDAIERTAYRPFEGRRRVVVFDPADAITFDAQDALLKSLEEPPSSSVFILVTARPDVLAPTVRSRVCRLQLAEPASRRSPADDEDYRGARGRALEVLDAAAGGQDPSVRLRSAQALAAHQKTSKTAAVVRDELTTELRAMASLLRDLGILSTGAERALANADLERELDRLSRAYDRERSVRAFTAVDRALRALERNASAKVVADWVTLQL